MAATMEKSRPATWHLKVVLQEPCGVIIFLNFLIWFISKIKRLLPSSCQSCTSPSDKAMQTSVIASKEVIKTRNKFQGDDMELKHEDTKIVIRKIGLNPDQEYVVCKCIDSASISQIFYVNEPSLHEVKQAFLLFDADEDGYLDAPDLQRVIQSLGLGEGLGMGGYEQMIAKYDTNREKKIDIADFTKVLEASNC